MMNCSTFVCSPSTPLAGLGSVLSIPTANAPRGAGFAQAVGAEASDGLKGSTFACNPSTPLAGLGSASDGLKGSTFLNGDTCDVVHHCTR